MLFTDLWKAITKETDSVVIKVLCLDGTAGCTQQGPFKMSIWIAAIHVTTNLTFIALNWYWFWGIMNLLRRRITRWRGAKLKETEGDDYYPSLKDLLVMGEKSKAS